ncbi:MAG TPA: peptidoglycan DD-metalloendopeptidase family protein [Burkholderiales bacterium]|jgi:murein DD-endopeptidase MepM/ murein hydrolase activator NlpD|nr:peptidoglycan DD-metalloendopeptidase family protein [Burkholderiales bacterium]HXR58500.1 peptidoglycan DD-metalloendopeptidase family protein [Burkholderiales bacterium]
MGILGPFARSAAVVVLAVFGAVAAFATIAPSPDAQFLLSRTSSIEALPIPAEALLPSPASYIREERFQRGDTLAAFLLRLGVSDGEVAPLARQRAFQALRPGYNVAAEVSAEGRLVALSFLTSRDTLVQVSREGEEFRSSEERAALYTQVAMKSTVVQTSLFAASDAAGIPDGVAMQLADIFGGDIDFHRDLRKGDQFAVVYELHHLAGRPVRAGRVLAAEFSSRGKTYRAVHYGNGYYAPDGNSLRKAFLRAPLEFSRVSSGFGLRVHPIARSWRAHQGIDYAAPTGTRVRAVGDAVVEHAGPRGGYGNTVILRHAGQYTTVYAHLSRIAVRRGAHVAQNDTIGFVGQTGWATGPHLHYEFRVAGQARNPMSIAMPAASPVPAAELAAFQVHAAPLIARLELLANSNLALLE